MEKHILAVVTMKKDQIGGGAPIFVMQTVEEVQQTAFILEKILDGMVHQVTPETLIVVRHH